MCQRSTGNMLNISIFLSGINKNPKNNENRRSGNRPEETRLEKRLDRLHIDDQKQTRLRPVLSVVRTAKSRNFGQVLRLQGLKQECRPFYPANYLPRAFQERHISP